MSGHPFPTTPRVSFPQPAKAKMPDTVSKNSGVSLSTEPSGAGGVPHWAVTSDLSGQLVSRENAGAHGGLRGEQPGDPAPALQGRARRPHREMDTPPRSLTWEPPWPRPLSAATAPHPPVHQLSLTVGKGFCGDVARPGKAVNASGGGARLGRTRRAAHLQTACRPGRRTRDHAGEGQNRTEENSEERPPWPALSSSPARRNGQGPRGGAGTRTAPGQRGSWDTCVVTCAQDKHA